MVLSPTPVPSYAAKTDTPMASLLAPVRPFVFMVTVAVFFPS